MNSTAVGKALGERAGRIPWGTPTDAEASPEVGKFWACARPARVSGVLAGGQDSTRCISCSAHKCRMGQTPYHLLNSSQTSDFPYLSIHPPTHLPWAAGAQKAKVPASRLGEPQGSLG